MVRFLGALLLAVLCPAGLCWAWGAIGHEWISGIAIEQLPETMSAFVRTPEAVAETADIGRELDRSKGAGETHDKERDPGHYMNFAGDGSILGVLPIAKLPATREGYDTQLRAKGFAQYKAGFLTYSIVDGCQQIRKGFAYWRADMKGAEPATTPEERAWFEADRRLREKLTLRDIGIWSHYVGDATQPMHVSVHFNGWGDFPNPNGYTQTKIHAHFEGAFIRQNFDRGAVAADVASYVDCSCTIEDRTRMLILSSLAQVGPLYQFEKEGGFRKSDQRGVAFATARLSTGAQAVRDLIVDAWLASADAPVGHPMVNVRDIESGKVRATWELMGSD